MIYLFQRPALGFAISHNASAIVRPFQFAISVRDIEGRFDPCATFAVGNATDDPQGYAVDMYYARRRPAGRHLSAIVGGDNPKLIRWS